MFEFPTKNIDTSDWKEINIEYLENSITVKVPPACETLQMKPTPPLKEAKKELI